MDETPVKSQPMMVPEVKRFAPPNRASFLTQAILLEETGPPRVPTMACLLGFLFVAFAILAGTQIQIDVVSTSSGNIAASNGNYILESFDGGIVDRVISSEGQVVNEGDLLVSLHDPEGKTQLDQLTVREAGLVAQVSRLKTLADLPNDPQDNSHSLPATPTFEQTSILPLEREAMLAERSLIEAEIERRSMTISNLKALEKENESRLSLVEEELEIKRKLFEKGLQPRTEFRDAEREMASATTDLVEVRGQILEAEASLVESKKRLSNVIAERRQRQGDNLSSILLELSETRQQIKAIRQRLKRAQIKATGRGVILELKVKHQGQIIARGDPIAEIIPIDGGLVADIRLPPSEIGHVREGQSARISIDGIDPHRHGYIQGEIGTISHSTFLDENGMPYYRASIDLPSNSLGNISLAPGMIVQTQIKTGERTIIEYLLKPVYRAWDTAFRER